LPWYTPHAIAFTEKMTERARMFREMAVRKG
jgi:hypothetical protein